MNICIYAYCICIGSNAINTHLKILGCPTRDKINIDRNHIKGLEREKKRRQKIRVILKIVRVCLDWAWLEENQLRIKSWRQLWRIWTNWEIKQERITNYIKDWADLIEMEEWGELDREVGIENTCWKGHSEDDSGRNQMGKL